MEGSRKRGQGSSWPVCCACVGSRLSKESCHYIHSFQMNYKMETGQRVRYYCAEVSTWLTFRRLFNVKGDEG
jgi:hypothetical protein